MTDETKERIAAINTGIIPDGYKKTKVGIVPIEWEVKKILDFCEIIGGGTPSTKNNDYWNGDIPWISSSDLKDNNIYNINISRYITKKAIEKSATKICPPNTIHLVSRVGVGKIAFSHCRICTSQDFVNIIKYDCDKLYLVYALYQKLQKEINNAQGTSIKGITTQEIKNFLISIPPLSEQQKIAEILSTQDKLIELYERKIEQLKTLKKGYLQKMFPKKCAKSPELRFKGFTEPWEKRKLGAVLSLLKDGTHGTHKNSDEGVFLLSAKNIKNGEVYIDENADRRISKQEFDSIHSNFRLQENDVLLTIVGSIGEVSILKNPDIMTFQRSVAFLRPKDSLLSTFLKTEIESYDFQKELSNRKSQSAQPGVYLGELEKIPFNLPNVEEQQQIGSYFSNLDRLITLHQHKLDKEKQKKKALMQLLLTGKVRVST